MVKIIETVTEKFQIKAKKAFGYFQKKYPNAIKIKRNCTIVKQIRNVCWTLFWIKENCRSVDRKNLFINMSDKRKKQ